jgi:flagellar biosynthesis GTPase FlhF
MAQPDDIDALFQAPLAEFTAARNALAKARGADGAAIRGIEKPSAAAWAVNQIYWRQRRIYDQLVRASDRLRGAHAQILKGKHVDLAPLDQAHHAAVRTAVAAARDALVSAGDAATPATMNAVQDAVGALPVDGPPGRLTRPPAPVGFNALTGLLKSAGARRAAADVVAFARPKADTAQGRKQAEAERKAEEAAEAREKAEAVERAAARRKAEAKQRALEEKLKRARLRVGALTEEIETATAEVTTLERQLQSAITELARLPR